MKKLSKESRKFLENLNLYLVANGKKDNEIQEIISDLQQHLQIAESEGKNIEHIIGQSPKQYMQLISREMSIDNGEIFNFISVILMGLVAFTLVINAFNAMYSYSVFYIIGTLAILGLFLVIIRFTALQLATKMHNQLQTMLSISVPTLLLLGGFILLIFLDRKIDTPVIIISPTFAWILAIASILLLIGISIWSKTAIILVLLGLLLLPKFISHIFTLSLEIELILSAFIPLIGLGIYVFIVNKRMKNT